MTDAENDRVTLALRNGFLGGGVMLSYIKAIEVCFIDRISSCP